MTVTAVQIKIKMEMEARRLIMKLITTNILICVKCTARSTQATTSLTKRAAKKS